MDWYEEHIEEPVRDLVKYLRNNGVNTECSCGHDMYIQCQLIPDGELQYIHRLLYSYYSNKKIPVNYTISIHHRVLNGTAYTSLLNENKTEIDRLQEQKSYIERRIKELCKNGAQNVKKSTKK